MSNMVNNYLRAGDTVNGKRGWAQAIIKNSVENLFMIKQLEATVEKIKEEMKALGFGGTQHKADGYSGSGTMTIYYVTSLFRRLMLEYMETGRDVYFDIIITNEDPTSTIGRQTVALYGCNLDSVVLTKLDVDTTMLDEEVSFTFHTAAILEEFVLPSNM